jgi:hypothetical protein
LSFLSEKEREVKKNLRVLQKLWCNINTGSRIMREEQIKRKNKINFLSGNDPKSGNIFLEHNKLKNFDLFLLGDNVCFAYKQPSSKTSDDR